jgi:hypothetical protein
MTHPAPSAAPRRRLSVAAAGFVVALSAAACGAPLMTLPRVSPGASVAADARQAYDEATAACRAISSFTPEIGVRDRLAGSGFAPACWLSRRPASVRLEAFAGSQPIFFFVARGGDATW